MGVEILSDLPDVDVVIVPIGGGGLAAGVGTYIKTLRPSATIIGVEPEGAPSMKRALAEGEAEKQLMKARAPRVSERRCELSLHGLAQVSESAARPPPLQAVP